MPKNYHKNIKPTAGAVIVYLILSVGLWGFLYSYSASEGQISGERTSPAAFGAEGGELYIRAGTAEYTVPLVSEDSDIYLAAYLMAPDEVRAAVYALTLKSCS